MITEIGKFIEVHMFTEKEALDHRFEETWFDHHIYKTQKPNES
jgi:hypothetical protein